MYQFAPERERVDYPLGDCAVVVPSDARIGQAALCPERSIHILWAIHKGSDEKEFFKTKVQKEDTIDNAWEFMKKQSLICLKSLKSL